MQVLSLDLDPTPQLCVHADHSVHSDNPPLIGQSIVPENDEDIMYSNISNIDVI